MTSCGWRPTTRRTEIIHVTEEDIRAVTDDELAGFHYTEHAENVALSLKILEDFGIGRGKALVGLWKARPGPWSSHGV